MHDAQNFQARQCGNAKGRRPFGRPPFLCVIFMRLFVSWPGRQSCLCYSPRSVPQKNSATVPGPVCEPMVVPM